MQQLGCYATDINLDLTCGSFKTWIGILSKLKIPGLSKPYAYIGGYPSYFNLHTEDKNLHSASLLLAGYPKFWWCIPGDQMDKAIEKLKNIYPNAYKKCKQAWAWTPMNTASSEFVLLQFRG